MMETLSTKYHAVPVVGFLVKEKGSAIVQIAGKLVWGTFAQRLDGSGYLPLRNSLVLLLFGGRPQALPRKRASHEVDEDVSQRLHVISPRLFDTTMSVD